jgi:glycosyltransferase involved in cell wall biosynthesis
MSEKERPAISVLIATRNRANSLNHVLSGLMALQPQQLRFEVLVVDNGSQDETPLILGRPWDRFTLIPLYEEVMGKSRALNRALEKASGELLVFTDDDVTVSADWLMSLYASALRFPTADVFCGPIVPNFPPHTPQWLPAHPFAGVMFGKFEPQLPEGPLPDVLVPFGANFAVRSSAIGDKRFRLDLGPSKENGPSFGEDTEFIQHFRRESRKIIFVPGAEVVHNIRSEQIEMRFIFERSFHLGRGHASYLKRPRYVHAPARFRPRSASAGESQRFERAAFINYYAGQLCEFLRTEKHSFAREMRTILEQLEFLSYGDLLCESARQLSSISLFDRTTANS